MITRIVKMEFKENEVPVFMELFNKHKLAIKAQPGCKSLSLLTHLTLTNVFFTYSTWENESDLENYKNSTLFALVWPATKKLFISPAQAWSTIETII